MYADKQMGLFVIRGDNVVLMGELVRLGLVCCFVCAIVHSGIVLVALLLVGSALAHIFLFVCKPCLPLFCNCGLQLRFAFVVVVVVVLAWWRALFWEPALVSLAVWTMLDCVFLFPVHVVGAGWRQGRRNRQALSPCLTRRDHTSTRE